MDFRRGVPPDAQSHLQLNPTALPSVSLQEQYCLVLRPNTEVLAVHGDGQLPSSET
jgi:hypothetical protein